jgi:hypothetical protein
LGPSVLLNAPVFYLKPLPRPTSLINRKNGTLCGGGASRRSLTWDNNNNGKEFSEIFEVGKISAWLVPKRVEKGPTKGLVPHPVRPSPAETLGFLRFLLDTASTDLFAIMRGRARVRVHNKAGTFATFGLRSVIFLCVKRAICAAWGH